MIDDATLDNLPESSGVYIYRDEDGRIIYIGKAKNIRDRVRSYFRESGKDSKTERLVQGVDRVDIVLTANEKEAFLLENNLIKEHTPKYNINLKDDKTYVSLRLTLNDPFPALYVTRKINNDGALYFGPYPHAKDVKDVLKLIRELYPVRRCKNTVFRSRKRACMLLELGKCLGPCTGGVDEKTYTGIVEELKDFLSGRDEKLLKDLEGRIEQAARSWNFEAARTLKERYLAIRGMTEKQNVHEHLGKNRDVWAFMAEEGGFRAALLSFRKGVLIAKRSFKEPSVAADFQEALSSFLFQYYDSRPIPDEIMLSEEITDLLYLERYLRDRSRIPVKVYGPGARTSQDMISMAIENLHDLKPEMDEKSFGTALHLKKDPLRIEIYDISHTGGTSPTGVMVVYEKFKEKKSDYRVFHIRGSETMDDVAMMAEVIERRMTNEQLGSRPDLLIIDGGKGHLSGVMKVLRALKSDAEAIGIAKGQRRKRMEDIIYLPMRKNPLPLPKTSPVFKEIVKMRDEAHRFAITSHKKWKRRVDLQTKSEK
jgi:excinuclease ABC subunit C